jgi:hypothetical protein
VRAGRGRETGATAVETAIAACVLLGTAAVMIVIYLAAMERAQDGVATARLRALRTQERVFRAMVGRLPADLRELTESRWSLFPLGTAGLAAEPVSQALRAAEVDPSAMDAAGYPVDPWGMRFAYDPATGGIRCATPGKGAL